jgi:hypothetical protein
MSEDELREVDVSDPQQGQAAGEESDLAYLDLEERDRPGIDVEEAPEAPARKRRGCLWWTLVVLAALVGLAVVLVAAGAVLYEFGTMQTPSDQVLTQYDSLAANGQVPPAPPSPGFRIPIPGCTCHAADANIAAKVPGRHPDPVLVVEHRYRTIAQCMDCHGSGKEPAGIEGQPTEDAPAQ